MNNGVTIKKILLPTDLSENAEHALRYANEFSKIFDAKLYILHVITDIQAAVGYIPGFALEDVKSSLREYFLKEITHLRNKYLVKEDAEVLIRYGNVPREIVECAREKDVDLIIMGAHGLSGIEKFIFGSVTERVLGLSTKPVLAIKIPKEKA